MSYVKFSQNVKIIITTFLFVILVGCGGARTETSTNSNTSKTDGLDIGTGTATLDWMPPTENTDGSPLEDLAGYKVYYGTTEGVYSNVITINSAGITTYVIDNLSNGRTYYFVLTAFNSSGDQSSYSAVINKNIPPAS